MPFGRNRDNIRILGDIVSPIPAEWFGDLDDLGEDLSAETMASSPRSGHGRP